MYHSVTRCWQAARQAAMPWATHHAIPPTPLSLLLSLQMYYVHMLQVEEKKEMRKYVDVEIRADKEAKRAAKRANKASSS